jgi:hypothetical protein
MKANFETLILFRITNFSNSSSGNFEFGIFQTFREKSSQILFCFLLKAKSQVKSSIDATNSIFRRKVVYRMDGYAKKTFFSQKLISHFSFFLFLFQSYTHRHTLSLSLFLKHAYIHTHRHSPSLSFTNTLTHTLSLSNTNIYTLTLYFK